VIVAGVRGLDNIAKGAGAGKMGRASA